MKITYDPKDEAVYIYIKKGVRIAGTTELSDSIFVDKNSEGEILGIEILYVPSLKLEVEK